MLGLVDQMREERLSPDSYTFVAVIRTLKGTKGAYERARQLLEDAKTSLQGPTLARVYAAVISGCGSEARYGVVCAVSLPGGVLKSEASSCRESAYDSCQNDSSSCCKWSLLLYGVCLSMRSELIRPLMCGINSTVHLGGLRPYISRFCMWGVGYTIVVVLRHHHVSRRFYFLCGRGKAGDA